MTKTVGIFIFDGAEELDFVGPYEVFTMSNELADHLETDEPRTDVVLISEKGGRVECAKGMTVMAHHSFETAPALDVVLVPGGRGTRKEVLKPQVLDWIGKVARNCEWVTSVCTGAMILTAAGPGAGKRVTTHWSFIDTLEDRGEAAEVLKNIRYVRDGNVVTAAGVSAGIDMALWLLGQMYGPGHARMVQRMMEYDPAPPYAAEV